MRLFHRPQPDVEGAWLRHADAMYRIALARLNNDADAQDAVQDVFLNFMTAAPVFENADHEKAWLIRVATNECRDLLRFRVRHPLAEVEQIMVASEDSTDSGILEALASLPEKYKLVLALYYVEGYKVEDIAKIIGRTSSAVKMRLQKGRRLLEKVYREEYL